MHILHLNKEKQIGTLKKNKIKNPDNNKSYEKSCLVASNLLALYLFACGITQYLQC